MPKSRTPSTQSSASDPGANQVTALLLDVLRNVNREVQTALELDGNALDAEIISARFRSACGPWRTAVTAAWAQALRQEPHRARRIADSSAAHAKENVPCSDNSPPWCRHPICCSTPTRSSSPGYSRRLAAKVQQPKPAGSTRQIARRPGPPQRPRCDAPLHRGLAAAASPALEPILFEPNERRRTFRWDHLMYAYMIENLARAQIFRRMIHEFATREARRTDQQSQKWLRDTKSCSTRTARRLHRRSTATSARTCRPNRRNRTSAVRDRTTTTAATNSKPYSVRQGRGGQQRVRHDVRRVPARSLGRHHLRRPPRPSSNPLTAQDRRAWRATGRTCNVTPTKRRPVARRILPPSPRSPRFHLTLGIQEQRPTSSPIVTALRARRQRHGTAHCSKIAERVGLPARGLSKHSSDLADAISRILIQIESGDDDPAEAVRRYTPRRRVATRLRRDATSSPTGPRSPAAT